MRRNRSPLRCHHCRQEFPRVACAGLFCGGGCQKEHEAQMAIVRSGLEQAGFEKHPEVGNLWVKDGVAIAEEHAKAIGIDKALAVHASHAAGIKQQASGA